jgi:hypothetical protein
MKPSELIMILGRKNPKVLKKVKISSPNHGALTDREFDVVGFNNMYILLNVDGYMPNGYQIMINDCTLSTFDSNELKSELHGVKGTILKLHELLSDDTLGAKDLDSMLYLERLNSCTNDVERLRVLSELC